jgi:hypothetical protein
MSIDSWYERFPFRRDDSRGGVFLHSQDETITGQEQLIHLRDLIAADVRRFWESLMKCALVRIKTPSFLTHHWLCSALIDVA